MFQGLTQGATISVLFKNKPHFAEGRVVSVNTHMPTFNPNQPMAMMNGPVTDITVQVENETIPFAGLPANGIVANFPDKGLFIATEMSAILREIDSVSASLRQDLEGVPAKQKLLHDYEDLRVEIDPERKKEAQQTREMTALRNEVAELKELLRASLGQTKKEE